MVYYCYYSSRSKNKLFNRKLRRSVMKKLLIALLALGTLSIVPTAEAGRRSSAGSCHKDRPCHVEKSCKPCAPKCTTTERIETFTKPCQVLVPGECPHERCIKTTICETESESTKCTGPCVPNCEQ